MQVSLAQPVFRFSQETPDAPAVNWGTQLLSYAQLAQRTRATAEWIASVCPSPRSGQPRVGILGSRSGEACIAVLGAAWAGAAYVPFSPRLPEERILAQLAVAELDALITDVDGASSLTDRVLARGPRAVLVGGHPVPGGASLPEPVSVDEQALAYIIFTSGTTGIPKGVMVSAGSVHRFLTMMQERYQLRPDDRCTENTDLTFDVSVANMYMAWGAGASLHIVPPTQAMAPAKFIQSHRPTVWSSVPSVISFMKSLKQLRPGAFPDLRYSLFAGEPLSFGAAQAWQASAPNSLVDNLYGPTEATVVCIGQRLTDPPLLTPRRDLIATGRPLPGNRAAIVDDQLSFLPPGEQGELALSGCQLAQGYLNSPELTARRFPLIQGQRWYLTGDLAIQDSQGNFHHLGRIDSQVKVLGNRVELEEIETHLRAVSGCPLVAAVAWPVENGAASGVVGFLCATDVCLPEIREAMKKRLPGYMVPKTIHTLEALPLNPNGKLDRQALIAFLAERA